MYHALHWCRRFKFHFAKENSKEEQIKVSEITFSEISIFDLSTVVYEKKILNFFWSTFSMLSTAPRKMWTRYLLAWWRQEAMSERTPKPLLSKWQSGAPLPSSSSASGSHCFNPFFFFYFFKFLFIVWHFILLLFVGGERHPDPK